MAHETLAPWAEAVPDAAAPMSAEELAQLPDDGYRYEIVEGRLVRMPPPRAAHRYVASRFHSAVAPFVYQHGLGSLFASETGFLISVASEADTLLACDLAFVRSERLPPPGSPAWQGYLRLAPDLVLEVASPDQYRPEMGSKARLWLAGRTRLVWVAWPTARAIDVWPPGADVPSVRLGPADALDGLDVLPGFVHPVSSLFQGL